MEKNNVKAVRISPLTVATEEPFEVIDTKQPIIDEISHFAAA